uniref:Selenoprotein T n=1 Tax=Paramormyrops kingsleyae TaxID=1676925 RepID=A0A3B3RAG6_9TELE
MAEYSRTGILTALLLFTVVTLRDFYLGRNLSEEQQRERQTADIRGAVPESPRDLDALKAGKPQMYMGPVLRFQYSISGYSKVYQEYSWSISQLYPDIKIEGENYPPKPINYLANFISYFKLLVIALIVSGQNPFPLLGIRTPAIWSWGQDNKQIFSCLMMFFISNMLETHFLSTGAFEITLNVPVWSKLNSGRVPNIQELFQILDNHLKMNQ